MKINIQLDHILPKRSASNAWRGIVKAKDVLMKGTKMMVKNGTNTAFWLDVWIEDQAYLSIYFMVFIWLIYIKG